MADSQYSSTVMNKVTAHIMGMAILAETDEGMKDLLSKAMTYYLLKQPNNPETVAWEKFWDNTLL